MATDGNLRSALDGSRRRRMFLFRHGSVDYVNDDGSWVDNPDDVPLNKYGIAQAEHMSETFADISLDRAVCSGLRRTRETGQTVLGSRDLELEHDPAFEEIRPPEEELAGGYDVLNDVAFSHWRAPDPEARFLGGERYVDFYDRISIAMSNLVSQQDWNTIAVFAHGGTNAAALGWVSGLGVQAFGVIDQQTCCLNIIDFDCHPEDGQVLRKSIRAMNITSTDPLKSKRHASDMEQMAMRLIKTRGD